MTTEVLLKEYFGLVVFFGIAFGLSAFMVLLAYLRARQRPYPEKLSPYECGFNPLESVRHTFDVRFCLVAILFIIFDIEVAFLFPWAVSLQDTGVLGFLSMMIFLGILTLGFLYEWKKGALDWE